MKTEIDLHNMGTKARNRKQWKLLVDKVVKWFVPRTHRAPCSTVTWGCLYEKENKLKMMMVIWDAYEK